MAQCGQRGHGHRRPTGNTRNLCPSRNVSCRADHPHSHLWGWAGPRRPLGRGQGGEGLRDPIGSFGFWPLDDENPT